jgi:Domain of unknown function (DUF4157)
MAMKTRFPRPTQRPGRSPASEPADGVRRKSDSGFADNRPPAITQRAVREALLDGTGLAPPSKQACGLPAGPQTVQRVEDEEVLQGKADPIQRQQAEEEELLQGKFDAARLPPEPEAHVARTGLPDALKSGIEALSGLSMDHVKVHHDSARPAQFNALAYAQGNEIHVGPGQEQYLPHEAWHVVQQAQGRVRPTIQMNEGVPVNDDAGLEREADVMGARAADAFSQDVPVQPAPWGPDMTTAHLQSSSDRSSGERSSRTVSPTAMQDGHRATVQRGGGFGDDARVVNPVMVETGVPAVPRLLVNPDPRRALTTLTTAFQQLSADTEDHRIALARKLQVMRRVLAEIENNRDFSQIVHMLTGAIPRMEFKLHQAQAEHDYALKKRANDGGGPQ